VTHLYEVLADEARRWRDAHYVCEKYPAIGEILDWQVDTESGVMRFLRNPQLRALDVYWYLRLVRQTPTILQLYDQCFPDADVWLDALGIPYGAFKASGYSLDRFWKHLSSDDDYVKKFRLQAVRESLGLEYPSYIFALAMGAGKTVLIGSIVATEFALAMEYPDADFAQNALVFAPGKTILEALRQLEAVPY